MTSDLSSTLEVCFKRDALNKSMFTLLYLLYNQQRQSTEFYKKRFSYKSGYDEWRTSAANAVGYKMATWCLW